MRNPIFAFVALVLLCGLHFGLSPVLAQSNKPGKSTQKNIVYLSDLKPVSITGNAPTEGNLKEYWKAGRCSLRGQAFDHGVSFHCSGEAFAAFRADRHYKYFEAYAGFDDDFPRKFKVKFVVMGDNKELYKSDTINAGDEPAHIRIDITDVARVELYTLENNPMSHFNPGDVWWGDARFIKGSATDPAPSKSNSEDSIEPDSTPSEQDGGKKTLRLDPERIKELALELKTKIAKDSDLSKSKPTLALAAFKLIPADKLSPDNADNVREDLSTALIDTGAFEVVERGQLQRALDELKLGYKDTFDSSKAQKLGKQVGARVVMIGSISDRGDYAVINIRLIDTATGKARIAASVRLPQDPARRSLRKSE